MVAGMRIKCFFAVLVLVLFSCSETGKNHPEAKGEATYGGNLRMMSKERITGLFPMTNETIYDQRINNQLFETLLKFNPEGTAVKPCLLTGYEITNDGHTYILKIRKNVFFHDDACFPGGNGRQLNAKDVLFCLEMACSGMNKNRVANLLANAIKGADAFRKSTLSSIENKTISGIQLVDDYTLKIDLEEGFLHFEKLLTHPNLAIYPKEAIVKYGTSIRYHPVGTGAFYLNSWNKDELELVAFPKYWGKDAAGNQLPFLDKITMTFGKGIREQLTAFRKEQVDIILEIPADEIENTIGTLKEAQQGKNVRHKLYSSKSLSVNYLAYTSGRKPFNDLNVRLAFSMALDKSNLIRNCLNGEGYAMLNGFVPSLPDYPGESVRGHVFDPEKARELLTKAGYPNGKGFPEVVFYINDEGAASNLLMQSIQKELKTHLNVDIKLKQASVNARKQAVKDGEVVMWKSAWLADYPDAINFLNLFYKGNDNHQPSYGLQYENPAYNLLMVAAMKENDPVKREQLLLKCDQMVIDEAVVIPLYNDDFIAIVNAKVRNFNTNSMDILDLSSIFIREFRSINSKK